MFRTLKLQESEDPYRIRRGRSSKPALLLKGKWMPDTGFTAGKQVNIKVKDRYLVITPA
jgi:hypothetical protein